MRRSPAYRRIPETIKEKVVMDAANMTKTELAQNYGLSIPSIRKILKAAGVTAKRNGYYENFDWTGIDKELGLTATDRSLALKYGISEYKARWRRGYLGREAYKPRLGWADDTASSAEIKRNCELEDLMYTWKRSSELRRYIHFANKWRHTLRLIRCS